MKKSDFDALLPGREFTRRDFVRATVGSGFAAAVMPITAQTVIHTDTEGLVAGPVTVPVGSFEMPAYRAAPANRPHAPLVLVVSEIFGVHEHIADVARRLAKAGYFALAPELFVRQGDARAYADIGKLLADVVSKAPDAQVLGDLEASLAWAKGAGADTSKAGITGFCWGGRHVWLAAASPMALKAGVAWYGPLAGTPSALKPENPLDIAGRLGCPVLGLYGGKDTGITQDHVRAMRAALAAGNPAARRSEIVVYPDAGHAFNADYRPSYNQAAAEDGWKRMLAWFQANGVA